MKDAALNKLFILGFAFLVLSITGICFASETVKGAGELILKYERKAPKRVYSKRDADKSGERVQWQSNTVIAYEKPITPGCTFILGQTEDTRSNKSTAGYTGFKTLEVSGVSTWFSAAAKDVVGNLLPEGMDGAQQITLMPKLSKLYSYPEGMNLHGVAAMNVDFSLRGEVVDTRHYRAFSAKTNWAGSSSEHLKVISDSALDLLFQLIEDLPDVCTVSILANKGS